MIKPSANATFIISVLRRALPSLDSSGSHTSTSSSSSALPVLGEGGTLLLDGSGPSLPALQALHCLLDAGDLTEVRCHSLARPSTFLVPLSGRLAKSAREGGAAAVPEHHQLPAPRAIGANFPSGHPKPPPCDCMIRAARALLTSFFGSRSLCCTSTQKNR